MRIIRLQAENIKRLKTVDISPKGPVVQITGKNSSGKSSTLDAIYMALAGADALPDEPLRRGADRGRSRLDLGDFIVERVFRKSGTTELTVRDGTKREPGKKDSELPKYGSPQDLLDGLLGRMTFDPLAFSRMKPREQFEELRRIAKVSVDIDALEAENEADFKKRTRVNGEVKSLRARVVAMTAPSARPDPVDESALVTELQNAAGHNTDIEKRRMNRESAATTVREKRGHADALLDRKPALEAVCERDVAELQSQIEALQKRIQIRKQQLEMDLEANLREHNVLVSQAEELDKKLANAEALPELIDVASVRQRLDLAKGINAEVTLFDQRKKLAEELTALDGEASAFTKAIEDRERQKTEAIASAEMPIDGLSLADSQVFFNGFPFNQASDAERLRVSAAIGMAGNPEIRVMRIKDGGLLDEDGMKLLEDMAREKDWQVWIEVTDSSGKIGVVMVDGEVSEDHQQPEQGDLLSQAERGAQ